MCICDSDCNIYDIYDIYDIYEIYDIYDYDVWDIYDVCDSVFRYWKLCLSHRPAGLIPFEIRQPVPPRVRAATSSLLIDVLLVSFCVL